MAFEQVNTDNIKECTDEKVGENASDGSEEFDELTDVNST
jgi:hypothetical protein